MARTGPNTRGSDGGGPDPDGGPDGRVMPSGKGLSCHPQGGRAISNGSHVRVRCGVERTWGR